jgi:hypothetical protein
MSTDAKQSGVRLVLGTMEFTRKGRETETDSVIFQVRLTVCVSVCERESMCVYVCKREKESV